jgi:hypothetical protein
LTHGGREAAPPASGEPEEPEAAALPRSWRELHPPRPKPEGVDYGFLSARGEPVASTRENLVHLARTRALPSLAWPPVLGALRDDIAARARREMRTTLGWSALLVLAFWVLTPPAVALMLSLFVGVFLALLIGRRPAAAADGSSRPRRNGSCPRGM